jgi:hypothetical protein
MKWNAKGFIKEAINALIILISNVFWIVLVIGGLMINKNFLGLFGIVLIISTLVIIGVFVYIKIMPTKNIKQLLNQ